MRIPIFLFFLGLGLNSESQINPRLKIALESNGSNFAESSPFLGFGYGQNSISAGIQLYDNFDVLLNFGYASEDFIFDTNKNPNRKKIVTSGIVLNYRFLKDFWISPSINLQGGFGIASNMKDQFMDNRMKVRPDISSYVIYTYHSESFTYDNFYRFNRWKFNFSPKLIVSFKMKDFNFDIGAGYAWNSFDVYVHENELRKVKMNGITFSASLGYRFKSWKKEK